MGLRSSTPGRLLAGTGWTLWGGQFDEWSWSWLLPPLTEWGSRRGCPPLAVWDMLPSSSRRATLRQPESGMSSSRSPWGRFSWNLNSPMEPNGSISTNPKTGGRIPVLETICSGDSLPLVVEGTILKALKFQQNQIGCLDYFQAVFLMPILEGIRLSRDCNLSISSWCIFRNIGKSFSQVLKLKDSRFLLVCWMRNAE